MRSSLRWLIFIVIVIDRILTYFLLRTFLSIFSVHESKIIVWEVRHSGTLIERKIDTDTWSDASLNLSFLHRQMRD